MHRNAKKKEWVVSKDDVGRAMLQWTVDARETEQAALEDSDSLAQTYNLLKRLELPTLELEAESGEEDHNPYNSGVYSARALRSKR